jgi:hypothetical protein
VTVNKDLIQRLIIEINDVLSQPNSNLPWKSRAEAARQRRVLELVRGYLREQLSQNLPTSTNSTENQAQFVIQSMLQDMKSLRTTLLRPLHTEVATLMQRRNALVQEIHQLEAHRRYLEQSALPAARGASSIEKLELVQDRADQILSAMDTTLAVVFQSLQKDVQAYQDSLSQGIDKLYTLGHQSEILFSGLVGRLAEQLGRDASAHLQVQESVSDSDSVIPPIQSSADISLPYPGTELSSFQVHSESVAPQDPPTLDSIRSLNELVNLIDVEEFPVAVPVMSSQKNSTQGVDPSPERLAVLHSNEASPSVASFAEAAYTPEENHLSENAIHSSALDVQLEMLSQFSEDLSHLNEECVANHAVQLMSDASPTSTSVFTLDGMDDIFLEDSDDEKH